MNRRKTKSASRRLVASGVAGVLLAVTAGCGSGGTGTGTQGGVTTITLSMQNQNVELSDPSTWELVKQFSDANPDIKVEVSGEPQAQHLQKLTVAAQSGTLPDIFWVYGMTARAMNQEGYLLDLAPLLSEQGLTDKFSSTSLEAFAEGHAQFGLPYQALITGYFYNKAILDEHGLQPPTTFDDLLVAAKTLNAAGVTTIAQGANQSAFSVWTYLTDLVRFGYYDKIEAILAGQESFNNPDFLRLYQNIAKLAEAGAFPANTTTQTFQQAVDSFAAGDAAFLNGGVWLSSYLQGFPIADQIGFWQGPEYADGVGEQRIVMNVPSAPFAVSKKVGDDAAKLAAVTKFLAFYYSDEGQQILADHGQPPVTLYEPQVAPDQTVFATVLEVAAQFPSPPAQPDLVVPEPVANAMYDSIYGVIQKQLTPEAALDLVQQAIDNI